MYAAVKKKISLSELSKEEITTLVLRQKKKALADLFFKAESTFS